MAVEFHFELVDTHCHLNFDVYDNDRDAVVDRARDNGITRILIPGIDIQTNQSAIEFAHYYPEVYAAVGIHPNSGTGWTSNSQSELLGIANDQKVVAIGEIGLDYYRDRTPRDIQKSIFIEQLTMAAELRLPVIIHNREASADIIDILREWHQTIRKSVLELAEHPGVMHSFSGDENLANELISLNFKLGISGPLTFQKNFQLQQLVRKIHIEYLLIETDAPFLTPHPFRGKRNEPANVRIVAEKIATLKETTLEQIGKVTTAEADRLFRWR